MFARWQSHDFQWCPQDLKRGNKRKPENTKVPKEQDHWRRIMQIRKDRTLQDQYSKSVIWEITRPRRADVNWKENSGKDQVKGSGKVWRLKQEEFSFSPKARE